MPVFLDMLWSLDDLKTSEQFYDSFNQLYDFEVSFDRLAQCAV